MQSKNPKRPALNGRAFIDRRAEWTVYPEHKYADKLAKDAGISPLLALLLCNRSITDANQAEHFLTPSLDQMHNWQLLPDVEPAVKRLGQARDNGESVLVHGDYDADGLTATALLVRAFRCWGLETHYHIPHRVDDGYGLSATGIERALELGCGLMVTVDCGISDHQQLESAASRGLDVIVTDHHIPGQSLPPAVALINPAREDSNYPFGELAGVGVAYKLAVALDSGFATDDALLQLAAVGTLADMVPLLGENRVLATLGLEALNRHPLPGLAALAKVAACPAGGLDEMNISFYLAPRLNAAGRMESPTDALELLLTDDGQQADSLAGRLQELNNQRQKVEESIMVEALPMAQEQFGQNRRVLVLHQPHWHQGVLGIVAARILHRFYRPAVVLCGESELTGSARSIPGFDIHGAISAASRWLERFGGHEAAAGLTLCPNNLPDFAREIDSYACAAGIDSMLVPQLHLEGQLPGHLLTTETAREITRLQPFGQGNAEPLFSISGITPGEISLVGSSRRHLRMQVCAEDKRLWSIGFGKANLVRRIVAGREINMAASLQLNSWNGRVSPQLRMEDIRDQWAEEYNGLSLRDRRGAAAPWLEELAGDGQVLWLANSRQALADVNDAATAMALPPDNINGNVYNLGVGDYALLEAPWSPEVFSRLLAALPRGSTLHLFSCATTPTVAAFPDLGALRVIYGRLPRQTPLVHAELLELLPELAGEAVLLDRLLRVFQQAGLARKQKDGWIFDNPGSKVDMEDVPAWVELQRQRRDYLDWLERYKTEELSVLTAPQGQTEEV